MKNLSLCICLILLLCVSCKEDYGDIAYPVNHDSEEYTGFGYIGGFETGAKAIFNINVETAGNYNLSLRGIASTATEGTGSVYVNEVRKGQVGFKGQQIWDLKTIEVTLVKGDNTITIQSDAGDNSLFYLDYIELQ